MFKKTHIKTLLASVLIGSMAAISTPAFATNEAMLDLLKILRDKGSISSEEYELLVNASKADKEKAEGAASEAKAAVKKATKDLPKINTKGKLEIKKGDNKFRIGGRLQADTTVGLGDVDFAGSEGGSPVTEFRRARMYLSGVLDKVWKFKFQYDFADDQSGATANTNGIKDAYIAYTGFKPVSITFGHHKTPMSIEELTSSKYITFIERSQFVNGIVADMGGGRQYAVTAKSHFADQVTLAGSYYIGSSNEDDAENTQGFVGRITWSPWHEKTRAFHLGFAYNHNNFGDGCGGGCIDAEPEVHPGADILEIESSDHKNADVWVAEASGVWGPFSAQWEYAAAEISDAATLPDLDATAWYIYGSYYLTGESRRYNWKGGSYKQTKVKNPFHKGGWGAWELALRYTSGEFDNSTAPVVDSEADVLTAGVNWYPSNNIRFSANYVDVLHANGPADAELAGDLSSQAVADAEEAEYFVLRGQWYF